MDPGNGTPKRSWKGPTQKGGPSNSDPTNETREDADDYDDGSGVILSQTMARTIQDLERLVQEAVELAEAAGALHDDGDAQDLPSEGHHTSSSRPTTGLAKKISQYLVEVSSKSNDVESSESGDSSKPTSPYSSSPQNEKEVEEESRRCRGACSANNLQILPPEPVAEPLHEKKTKLSRERSSTQPSSSRTKPALRFLAPPEIGLRTTSANRYQESKTLMPLPTPAIQLNGENLTVESDEDKEPLLQNPELGHERHFTQIFGIPSRHVSMSMAHPSPLPKYKIDLNGTRHVDIPERADDLDVHSTCHHAPVARNWPTSRKRFAAWVSCINAACVGLLLGIYAGEVPAIQYVIVDLNRKIILGNVLLYLGLAFSTLLFWPLPLLHGRKPYNLVALSLALCLQIPQGIMVISFRDPDVQRYRIILLLSRGVLGFVLGFANINNFATLLDVFGASIQSSESHETGKSIRYTTARRRHGPMAGSLVMVHCRLHQCRFSVRSPYRTRNVG